MKRIALIAGLLASAFILNAAQTNNIITLYWTAPTNMPPLNYYAPGTNQAYKVYGTATLGTPRANWPLLAFWTNWTVSTDGNWFTNQVSIPAGEQFFFAMDPTNVWGEVDFGEWTQTGPLLSPSSIGLKAGQ